MADFSTVGLLAAIRRAAMLPSASATGTADADLLALANEELWGPVTAKLLEVREEYLVTYSDTTLSGTEYRIPSRASAQALREAELRDSSGRIVHLTRYRPEQLEAFTNSTATPQGFIVRGGYLVLVPSANSSLTTLRMYFHVRPSELTSAAADYEAITAINTSTRVVTVGSTVGLTGSVDLVAATPGFEVLTAGITATASDATTLTFSSLPTGLAIGDYVCVAGKAPVPTIPVEMHRLLVLRTAKRVLLAQGDFESMEKLEREVALYEQKELSTLLAPRVQGSIPKTTPRASVLHPWPRRPYGGQ